MTLYQRPTDDPEVWAAVHAWRALAQCRAEAAAPALTDLLIALDDDDYAGEELPLVLGMIGAAAIAPIAARLADGSRSTRVGRLPSALVEIGQRHPEARAGCIEVLASLLQGSAGDGELAGFAVSALLDLRAVESIAAIRDAFARDAVDLSIAGDVEDVEIELGLRNERDTPRPRYIGWPGLERIAGQPGAPWLPQAPVRVEKIGRNEPCPCGSGRKYKRCCLG